MHSFKISDAKKYGITPAITLNYLTKEPQTLSEICFLLPYMSASAIFKVLEKLCALDLIKQINVGTKLKPVYSYFVI
jgi:hypothetical protein